MNNWLIKGNPNRNDLDEMLRNPEPDIWSTQKPIPRNFTTGDRAFIYESGVSKQLIALASVAEPHAGQDGSHNRFSLLFKTQRFKHTLHQNEIRSILEDPAFLKSGNAATIYPLSKEDAGLLLEAVVERNGYLRRDPHVVLTDVTEATPLVDEDSIFDGPEGNPILRTHLAYERRPELVERKKASVQQQTGRLACEVCDFEFSVTYGDRGTGFCEVHHRLPLSKNPPRLTQLSELAIVCSNCHRMLHRLPWMTVEDLRKSISDMRPTISHRGYEGTVLYSPEDRLLYGRILGIRALVLYEGTSISEIEAVFQNAVDEYLADQSVS